MSAPRPSIDSAYSSLFTAGILISSTPRSSMETSTRPSVPAPPPPPTGTSIFSHNHNHTSTRKSQAPRTPGRRRRSSVVSPAQAALKSPTRAEQRTHEMHVLRSPMVARLQQQYNASSSAPVAVKEKEKEKEGAWPGFLRGVWTPPAAAMSRLRRRPVPTQAPPPPPSAPLPAPPSSLLPPARITSTSSKSPPLLAAPPRPPLTPILIPAPPLRSFWAMDDDDAMDVEI